MPLDPKVQQLIAAMEAQFPALDPSLSGTEVRRLVKKAGENVIPVAPEPVGNVTDREIPGPLGAIPIRIYRPEGSDRRTPGRQASSPYDPGHDPALPLIVFFHGGGWVVCDLDSHDGICRAVTNASGCVVVAVDYRLAPEHQFPAPVEDAYAATAWLVEHGAEIDIDPDRVAVMGDSAGGNLAAAVTLMARDRGGPSLGFQVLVYPVTDFSADTPSHRNTGEGYFLKSDEVMYYWGQYLADPADGANPYASPLRAGDFSGLPPALVITAEFDPLRDEGEAYGRLLADAGVPVTISRYDGMFHSFLSFMAVLEGAQQARSQIGDALRAVFGLAPQEAGDPVAS